MKIAHLADLHLGFRQYDRVAPNGVNQREVDVAQTVSRAIDQVITEAPDLIVIGGDVFHMTRPTNNTIRLAFSMFLRLSKALPQARVVIVSGNHDAPKTADSGNILPLFAKIPNFHVVESEAAWIAFPELNLDMLCVPDVIGLQRPELRPRDPSVKHRVLLMHGEMAGVMDIPLPHDIPVADLHDDEWSYIALGHYHVYRQVTARAFYSGSLDYTSTDPWGEMREQAARRVPGKGFIVQDLDTGAHTFVPVTVARPWAELAVIDCADLTRDEINARIASAVATVPGGIAGMIVRVMLRNMPRSRMRELDQAQLRAFRLTAQHFQLDARKPEERAIALAVSTPERRRSLVDLFGEYLTLYPLNADIDRASFVQSGVTYLQRALDVQSASRPMAEAA